MKNLNFFILFILICSIFTSCSDNSLQEIETPLPEEQLTSEQQEALNGLNSNAHQLGEEPLLLTDNEMSFLDEVSDARIVGLGEATHGTKEFFQMKHRIFQFLVEHHGFKAFLFEIDLAEARVFNDWVQHRNNADLENLMINEMYFWTWRTYEVKELLEWMKSYNLGKSEEEMVGFYGVDNQTTMFNLDALLDIVNKVDSDIGTEIYNRCNDYRNLQSLYEESLTDTLVASMRSAISFTKEKVEGLQLKIKDQLGAKEAKWARQLVRHMEQVELVQYDGNRNNRYYQRDLYMAENTSWYFDLLGTDSKLVLWAHNRHLADDFQYGGPYGGSQGNYLRKEYGNDYQIIGFTFTKGSFTAVREGQGLRTQSIYSEPLKRKYQLVIL